MEQSNAALAKKSLEISKINLKLIN